MMKLNDSFMRHFRWITPLLLGFNLWLVKEIYYEFRSMQATVTNLRIDMAMVKTFLTKDIKR